MYFFLIIYVIYSWVKSSGAVRSIFELLFAGGYTPFTSYAIWQKLNPEHPHNSPGRIKFLSIHRVMSQSHTWFIWYVLRMSDVEHYSVIMVRADHKL